MALGLWLLYDLFSFYWVMISVQRQGSRGLTFTGQSLVFLQSNEREINNDRKNMSDTSSVQSDFLLEMCRTECNT